MIKILIILGLLVYMYFRFKIKNKLIDNLRKTITNTHDYYREKYDFFVHFKQRYDDLLEENSSLKIELLDLKEGFKNEIVIEKPKRSRKPKSE